MNTAQFTPGPWVLADEALDTWAPVFKAAMALAQAERRHHT